MKAIILLTAILALVYAKSVFEEKKIPHCVSDKGVTYVFTSPISEVAKDKEDIAIKCVNGKMDMDSVKEVKGEW